jgi:hypothetical protein
MYFISRDKDETLINLEHVRLAYKARNRTGIIISFECKAENKKDFCLYYENEQKMKEDFVYLKKAIEEYNFSKA